MSRTTDILLFAILLVLVAIWMTLDYDVPGTHGDLIAFGGLFIGLIAFGSQLITLLPDDDRSE
ncbi:MULTISPECIES: hypothetical protein [unclassified Haladaptatus]|uniref:hypothetical protein n=1 Tax=unclassified Haladaptatus TaxID=2622732 RepID=UPI00209C3D4F|nr:MULTISPECIES: hypothetical protein [unclassified Haladaptatus]MCO8245828.1 hypothetical protein [Haladaptatus sp. AB643]MCO8256175.1 hypothetical protein [Haladaptatus sp. AB618]